MVRQSTCLVSCWLARLSLCATRAVPKYPHGWLHNWLFRRGCRLTELNSSSGTILRIVSGESRSQPSPARPPALKLPSSVVSRGESGVSHPFRANHHPKGAAFDAIEAAGNGRSWLSRLFYSGHASRRLSYQPTSEVGAMSTDRIRAGL